MSPPNINSTEGTKSTHHQAQQWAEIILSILILAVLLLFSYTEIFLKPKIGFSINWYTGVITGVEPLAADYLQVDDRVLSINGIPRLEINSSIKENPLLQTEGNQIMDIVLVREGEEILVRYPKPDQAENTLFHIVSGDWILPLPFFAAGIITVLFIRPRTKTRLLLILFFYSFAIWISAGLISPTGYWAASTVMRVFIWLSLPVAFQLHWRFPIPFKFSRKWINLTGYAVFLTLALIEIIAPNTGNLYLLPFLATLLSSFIMLIVKYIRFKEHRKLLKSILLAYLLALLPLLLMVVFLLVKMDSMLKSNIALMGLTAIPGFYFFTGYRIHLKREIPKITNAQRLFTIGIVIEFLINFLIHFLPPADINPYLSTMVAAVMSLFISLTGFGILLIMPALANDQVNLFETETYVLRLSANRTAAFVIFMVLVSPFTLGVVFLITSSSYSQTVINLLITAVSTTITMLSILFYHRYRIFFDRVVLGIRQPPEELIRSFAHSISLSLEYDSLASLLKDEIISSLLIRESVLFYIQDDQQVMTLFNTGLTDNEVARIRYSLSSPASPLSNEECVENIKRDHAWVRVALPLKIKEKLIGMWCFGRKDPNDIYDQDFIKDLSSLANQTTLALLNIHQAELLIELYNANVNRQEEEKANIARDLHDVLLPSIGYLVELQNNNCSTDEFEQAVQRINDMIRDIMSGLRPATLDMGLAIALEELADEPEAQIGGKINIQTRLSAPDLVSYPKQAELHLFRMVQQASQNALLHAQADKIIIHGTILPDSLDLHVEDDGVGFPLTGIPNLSTLIANQHFGLANIFERAKIINADVKIDSQVNRGTSIHIFWKPEKFPKPN